ncbi:CinA family protein [Hydrogenophilus thiooxidans]|uniref:CinA family protein n=1 Tax=Hydrogenophilus thiooxidans TaxID=2820326 RepID=UPI001C24778C|nr:CinA family protein [Hydrogenophilus thiooxidans]
MQQSRIGPANEALPDEETLDDAQTYDAVHDVPPLLYDLAARVGRLLGERGETLATAESCTGGLIAAAITSVAGSSAWFEAGFVTYANRAKTALLGVLPETLAAHGAVSEATACEMANGARTRAATTWAVAVSGIAGPSGGTAQKPVGTVCFAWAGPNGVTATTRHFRGNRAAVRIQTVIWALATLLEMLARSARPPEG